jgi:hypothetical protein
MTEAIRFPKTPRVADALQADVHRTWAQHRAVVEEKVDGSNVGIFFRDGALCLQSRGHILRGGSGEATFAPFHPWAWERQEALWEALGERFVLYGEWMFAKNRAFYNRLPDWFLGFDVLDREKGLFLTVAARNAILGAVRAHPVPQLWAGPFRKAPAFGSFLGPSRIKGPGWKEALLEESQRARVRDVMAETDDSDWMEGVYVRVEDENGLVGRMKLHRDGFNKPLEDGWGRMPFVRNRCMVPP